MQKTFIYVQTYVVIIPEPIETNKTASESSVFYQVYFVLCNLCLYIFGVVI